MMNRTEQLILSLATPVAQEQGIDIWDVEYLKEAGQWVLRIYIDKEGIVSIDDCEAFSRAFEPVLDEKDPIESSYTFEVSSAGAERQLKRPSDFEKFIGENVEVKLYKTMNGSKSHIGKLVSNNEEVLVIEAELGQLTFNKPDISMVRLRIIF